MPDFLAAALQATPPRRHGRNSRWPSLRVKAYPPVLRRGVSADVRETTCAPARLQTLGATLVDVSLPRAGPPSPCTPGAGRSQLQPQPSTACASTTAQQFYDGLLDMYKKEPRRGFGAEVKRRIMIGAYVLSRLLTPTTWRPRRCAA